MFPWPQPLEWLELIWPLMGQQFSVWLILGMATLILGALLRFFAARFNPGSLVRPYDDGDSRL